MTGMVTASMIDLISCGSDIRATPPSLRMSAGTRSRAITAQAPASSAILACSGVTTSMMTPPFNISAWPALTLKVPVTEPFPVRSVITAEFYAWALVCSDRFGPLPPGQSAALGRVGRDAPEDGLLSGRRVQARARDAATVRDRGAQRRAAPEPAPCT